MPLCALVAAGALRAAQPQATDSPVEPLVAGFKSTYPASVSDAVELVVCLDTMFGVNLPDNALLRQHMRTLNTLVDLVLVHRAGRAHVAG